jgi:hypothetical protein
MWQITSSSKENVILLLTLLGHPLKKKLMELENVLGIEFINPGVE